MQFDNIGCDIFQSWGALSDSGGKEVTDFLEQIDGFITSLTSAQGSLNDQIYLHECDVDSALAKIRTMSDYQEWGRSTPSSNITSYCLVQRSY